MLSASSPGPKMAAIAKLRSLLHAHEGKVAQRALQQAPSGFSVQQRPLTPAQRRCLPPMRSAAVADPLVVGLDEVGTGALCGITVFAAVHLPQHVVIPGLADSKEMGQDERRDVSRQLWAHDDVVITLSICTPEQYRDVRASRLHDSAVCDAFVRARARVVARAAAEPKEEVSPSRRVVGIMDGLRLPQTLAAEGRCAAEPQADRTCPSVAAASIVAKAYRDAAMWRVHAKYPWYSFDLHKGYSTDFHMDMLAQFGVIDGVHRPFGDIAQVVEAGVQPSIAKSRRPSTADVFQRAAAAAPLGASGKPAARVHAAM